MYLSRKRMTILLEHIIDLSDGFNECVDCIRLLNERLSALEKESREHEAMIMKVLEGFAKVVYAHIYE